jgi:myo-inositol-1(or 4)-monophosphatase
MPFSLFGSTACRCTGCPALDLAWVAAGKFDGFVSHPLDYAEICAGEMIVTEAGGTVTMYGELMASNGKWKRE